jgi:hypothetical protein
MTEFPYLTTYTHCFTLQVGFPQLFTWIFENGLHCVKNFEIEQYHLPLLFECTILECTRFVIQIGFAGNYIDVVRMAVPANGGIKVPSHGKATP